MWALITHEARVIGGRHHIPTGNLRVTSAGRAPEGRFHVGGPAGQGRARRGESAVTAQLDSAREAAAKEIRRPF
nr:hypothetical protein KPHV_76580 [Kitasatospora purpeofusca]